MDRYRLSGCVLSSHCPLSFPLVYRGEMKATVTVMCRVPLMPAYRPVPLASQTGPGMTVHGTLGEDARTAFQNILG